MNRQELVEALRKEAWEIEALMKKMQTRRDRLHGLADDIESDGKPRNPQGDAPPNKFRKFVNTLYGEKPKKK
jgi:hypothetical protein